MIINVMPCPVFFSPVFSECENQPFNLENKTANVKNGGEMITCSLFTEPLFSRFRFPSALARCRIVEKKRIKTSVDRLDYLVISATICTLIYKIISTL